MVTRMSESVARHGTWLLIWTVRVGALLVLLMTLLAVTLGMVGQFATRERIILRNEPVARSLTSATIDVGRVDLRVRVDPAMEPGRITIMVRDAFESTRLERRVTDGALYLRAQGRGGGFQFGVLESLEVVLPPGLDLKIRSKTGEVRLDGPDGPVDVDTRIGDVEIHAPSSSALRVVSGSGEIFVGDARVGTLKAQAGGGTVTARFLAPPKKADVVTDSGDITLRLPGNPADGYQVRANSGEGDTSVTVPRNTRSDHVVQARSSSGDVVVATTRR
ncbi:MAG: hypothetical protein QG608_2047 [Actinomycetota bacterium]|nr:hypothetical protein [Actinomycetota bacterium]